MSAATQPVETWWSFSLTCPVCSCTEFRSVAPCERRAPACNVQSARVVACADCGREFALTVTVAAVRTKTTWPAGRPDLGPPVCGTERGYHAHRGKSPACQPCKDAHAAHNRVGPKQTETLFHFEEAADG